MTSRERVQCILEHKKPDRIAVDIGSTASGLTNPTMKKVKSYFHITSQDILFRPDESAAYYNDDVLEALGSDFRHIFLMPPDTGVWKFNENGKTVNEWGIEKTMKSGLAQFSSNPLADADSIEDLEKYPWPDPYAPGRNKGIKERIEYLYQYTDYALAARSVSHGIFELAWELRGMENLLCDMMLDKEFANYLFDKTLEIQIGLYDVLLEDAGKYVQVVETADDYGTQRGPMISPELFDEMILPRRKKLNDFIHSKAPQAKIFHHTCGSVYKLLPNLIASGVEILNPVQPSAADMDTFRLQEEYGDQLIFHGGIDEQTALVYGQDVLRKEMENRIASLGKNGGYIMAPTSNFQDDMPLENIIYFSKMAHEIGNYSK